MDRSSSRRRGRHVGRSRPAAKARDTWLTRSLLVASACALAACSDDGTAPPRVSSSSHAIIKGTDSTRAQDYVVQIAIEKNGEMIPHCTGTLVAKDLVLTARHCTGELSEDEESITDFEPSALKFYFGTQAGPKTVDEEPEAQGKKLFHNGEESLVPDIAVVQLDEPVDLPIAPIRLASGAVKGESLDVVGYGLTEDHAYPRTRQQRKGVKVAKVGPGSSTLFDLTEGEFQFGEAACAGDSGGPALSSETGALVGIASRVSNGEPRSDTELASFCMGRSAEDIYTDLVPARAFIEAAFEAAGATPWLEGEPSPEEKAAEEAAQGEGGSGGTSSPPPAAEQGCSAVRAPSTSASLPALYATALALAAFRARRARQASRRARSAKSGGPAGEAPDRSSSGAR